MMETMAANLSQGDEPSDAWCGFFGESRRIQSAGPAAELGCLVSSNVLDPSILCYLKVVNGGRVTVEFSVQVQDLAGPPVVFF